MPSQFRGSATRRLPTGSVAKKADSKAHKKVVNKPGSSPPNPAASRMNGTYVMNGIKVGGWSGSRATCARAANKDGAAVPEGRRGPFQPQRQACPNAGDGSIRSTGHF